MLAVGGCLHGLTRLSEAIRGGWLVKGMDGGVWQRRFHRRTAGGREA